MTLGKGKVDVIKKMARESLDIWQAERNKLIADADGVWDELTEANRHTATIMKAIFGIADRLSDAVRDCIDIDCPITPEVVAIVSSMVLGITNAKGAKEVEQLMTIRSMVKNTSGTSH